MSDKAKERHPFRFLLKLAMLIGLTTLVAKVIASKKDEYYGLTESEARAKFESKLGPRIGEKKASEIADQVIPKLRDSGVIKPDPVEEGAETTDDAGDDIAEAVEEVTS